MWIAENDSRVYHKKVEEAEATTGVETLWDSARPVSYTHLDVYKRQV